MSLFSSSSVVCRTPGLRSAASVLTRRARRVKSSNRYYLCMDKQSSNIFQRQKVDFAKCEETSGSLAPFDAALSRSWSEVSLYERTRRRCTTRALVITRRSCQGVGRVNGRDGIP